MEETEGKMEKEGSYRFGHKQNAADLIVKQKIRRNQMRRKKKKKDRNEEEIKRKEKEKEKERKIR